MTENEMDEHGTGKSDRVALVRPVPPLPVIPVKDGCRNVHPGGVIMAECRP
jgi:hypothetical protein